MANGVFLHRPDSIYNDRPSEQYQFPSQYLTRASQFIGDWIVYYEPRRGGTAKGYYAIARVENIVKDPSAEGMYLALIEPGSYMELERPVPFRVSDQLVERGLLNDEGRISGRAQAAIRPVSIADFNRILGLGIPDDELVLPRVASDMPAGTLREETVPFVFETERDRVTYYTSRPVRKRVFRTRVLDAYDCRCAITGLKFINGGGRAEVEAAHIKPVEHKGPDVVSNGLALSGTVHWMFDRGLISLSDDLDILVSRHVNDVEQAWRLIAPSRKAAVPADPSLRPHPHFLQWHRDNCFKQ